MNETAAEVVALKREFLLPCLFHFYKDPPVLVRGEMQHLYDSAGKKYLDAYSGVTVLNCGHCNPAITGPATRQAETLQHTTSIYLTEPMPELARKLVDFLDGSLRKAFFVNSGSEANEGALLLARLHTGKRGFISLRGGLHGRTHLTMSVTGIDMWRTDPFPAPHTRLAPRPFCTACELGLKPDGCGLACARKIEEMLHHDGDVAAFIAEPIQGNGGIVEPPPGYFALVSQILRKHGVLLIFDEVQTGFCRTGRRFAFKRLGLEPDILAVAKALGNGFPIGAFIARNEVAASHVKPGASTTGGNAVSATAAIAVLDYLSHHRLDERAETLGHRLRDHLLRLKGNFRIISDVRGRGLMLGMELGTPQAPATAETDLLLEAMKDRGFLIGKTGIGRNVVTFLPPLVVTETDLDDLATALEESLQALTK
jgi:4-aminobutyrate aminotransferase-like enzyme